MDCSSSLAIIRQTGSFTLEIGSVFIKILSQIPLAVGFILLGLVWAIIVGVVWAIRLGLVGWRLEEHSKLKRTKKAEKARAE